MSRRVTLAMRFAPFLPVLLLGACTTVLGIEDVEEDPNADNGGSATTDVEGGTKNTGGSKAGNSPTASMGGTGSDGGDGALGGDAPLGGDSPIGGDANMGGAPNPADPTVHGKVIDYWGQTIPAIPVQIGDTLVVTDDDGEFTIENVPDEYEVSLQIDFNAYEKYGWVYQGLTRRDPTLQVYTGLAERSGKIFGEALDVTVAANQKVATALGIPGGTLLLDTYQDGVHTDASWRGEDNVNATAHALYWQYDAATELPTAYLGYDSNLIALTEDSANETAFSFTLQGDPLVSGDLQGTVTKASGTDRANNVFLRFTSGAYVHVVNDTKGPNTFSYVVPDVPTGSVTVSASEGDAYYGEYAVAHKDGLSKGDTAALKIPFPSSLVGPNADATGINATTKFTILPGSGSAGTYVISMESEYFNTPYYDTLYVVTQKTSFTIPQVIGQNFMHEDNLYVWRVETHGKLATTDAMTGPTGFMDPFSGDNAAPRGPHTGDGQYTISSARLFTTAP